MLWAWTRPPSSLTSSCQRATTGRLCLLGQKHDMHTGSERNIHEPAILGCLGRRRYETMLILQTTLSDEDRCVSAAKEGVVQSCKLGKACFEHGAVAEAISTGRSSQNQCSEGLLNGKTIQHHRRDKELAKFEAYLNKEECQNITGLVRGRSRMAYPIKQ